jgi:serine protease Do
MDDLITKGRVVRGYLGVYIDTPDEEISQALGLKDKKGALVNQVADGAPADNAGLEAGDVIVEVNGKGIDDAQMLTNLIASYAPGETVTLKIIRNQESLTKKVTLAERDTTQVASAPENPADMRTRLGIDVQDLTSALAKELGYEGFEGVVVSGVQSGSVAAEKGLREGDLILSVDRKKVRNVEEFVEIVEGFDVGEIVLLQVRRQETNSFLALKIPEK